ncbi:MAG: hypothetical protein JW885_14820 [Deltaproteobacteria bacterium]|nr:hypothetical protein [Candidatus Zymogenaceae bacterium]
MNRNFPTVAVIVNRNARWANDRLLKKLSRILPDDAIYPTETVTDAEYAMEDILAGGYDIVFSGGGDGTIVSILSIMRRKVEEKRSRGKSVLRPPVGILKLGTGNAWAWAVGVKDGLDQLEHVVNGGYFSIYRYSLVEVNGLLCPFAGVGWDARILNDYYEVNRKLSDTPLRRFVGSLYGYFFAVFSRTIPHIMKEKSLPKVTVRFTGEKLLKPTREGEYLSITDMGSDVIYQGPASIAAAGTIPYFGYAFRMFPHADRVRGTMHLRIADLEVFESLVNILKLWNGTYRSPRVIDFVTDRVEMTFDRKLPLQVGGDPMGYTDRVEFSVPDFTAKVIAFWGM